MAGVVGLESFDRVLRCVWGDPKFVAEMEWHAEYGVGAQLARQWPRGEMEHYARTGQHVDPDRRLVLVDHEMPDFGWWEPRHDQPWRRQLARACEFGL